MMSWTALEDKIAALIHEAIETVGHCDEGEPCHRIAAEAVREARKVVWREYKSSG